MFWVNFLQHGSLNSCAHGDISSRMMIYASRSQPYSTSNDTSDQVRSCPYRGLLNQKHPTAIFKHILCELRNHIPAPNWTKLTHNNWSKPGGGYVNDDANAADVSKVCQRLACQNQVFGPEKKAQSDAGATMIAKGEVLGCGNIL
jgi:hypothetical protein